MRKGKEMRARHCIDNNIDVNNCEVLGIQSKIASSTASDISPYSEPSQEYKFQLANDRV